MSYRKRRNSRRGAMLVLAAIVVIVIILVAAFAIDIGLMTMQRTTMQSAADSSALAAASRLGLTDAEIRGEARKYAGFHAKLDAQGAEVQDNEVVVGNWNRTLRTFTRGTSGNAVMVTTRATEQGTFLARVFGLDSYDSEATAIACAVPRDIVFVVDLSGSMDDDTDPAWAKDSINASVPGSPGTSLFNDLHTDIYRSAAGSDTDLVSFLQSAGHSVASREYAYAVLTGDEGYLAKKHLSSL